MARGESKTLQRWKARRKTRRFEVVALAVALTGLSTASVAKVADMSLTLTSPRFEPGGEIPVRHTCEGQDVSPGLSWSGAPAGTKSFALIVDDPAGLLKSYDGVELRRQDSYGYPQLALSIAAKLLAKTGSLGILRTATRPRGSL